MNPTLSRLSTHQPPPQTKKTTSQQPFPITIVSSNFLGKIRLGSSEPILPNVPLAQLDRAAPS